MSSQNTPVIVGVGQLTNRPSSPADILEPLEMMARCTEAAGEDCGASILPHLQSISVINLISHRYADPAAQLAARIGTSPTEKVMTSMGGNSPQLRINETSQKIANGELDCALIAGAEAFHSLKIARNAGAELNWGPTGSPGTIVGDERKGTNEIESRHQAQMPIRVYPLFESALRAERKMSIEENQRHIARLCASLSRVAGSNPYAWFRAPKDEAVIGGDTPDNRMISFPYRKYMNAIMNVDQGAAIILTSTGKARHLGIPESKWVYVRGCGDAHDLWHVSNRTDLHSSPAIRLAGQRAYQQSGIDPSEIEHIDLYSCFPSAIQIGARMLGLPDDGSIPLTTTGALPYHGGPGSNYSTHAVAQIVDRIRSQSSTSHGLASGIGWYMTKHSVGIYSNTEPETPWQRHDFTTDQTSLDGTPHPAVDESPSGTATIEAYTVYHGRSDKENFGVAAVRTADGSRSWANIYDPSVLPTMESEEFVGRVGTITHDPETRINALTFA